MNETKQSTIGLSIICCLTIGIICTLIGTIIIFVSRLIFLRNPFKWTPVHAFWVGLAPTVFILANGPPQNKIANYDYMYTNPNKIELVRPPQNANIEVTWSVGVETPTSTPNHYECYNDGKYPIFVHGEQKNQNRTFIISDANDKIINNYDYGDNATNIRIKDGWNELRPMKQPTKYDLQFWLIAHILTCVIAFLHWLFAVIPGSSQD